MMKVFLVGMPGSGKSTLGKQIAEVINIPFIDLDTVIENQENLSIPELFKQKGENYFRVVERKALININSVYQEFVMATGGGAPCFFDNMAFIKENGHSIYLDISSEELAIRILNDGLANRPMFKNMNPEDVKYFLEDKLKDRAHFYNQATWVIDGKSPTPEMVLNLIEKELGI